MDAAAPPLADADAFPAIADYGIVGNLETVALIANTGAIEFFCYPAFDSPSIFAALLDRNAGSLTVAFDCAACGTQSYIEGTNVLVTRFEGDGRVVELTDFMPVGAKDETNQLVRIVRAVSGRAHVRASCRPAFDYGRGVTTGRQRSDVSVVFEDGGVSDPIRIVSDRPVTLDGARAVAEATLEEGEVMVLVIVADGASRDLLDDGVAAVEKVLRETEDYWRGWLSLSHYDGEFHAAVMRSALALKLMFSNRHGSIVAAPTMALPETIGGARNWDYRYCWLRDSAFTIYALLRLGFMDEADKYSCWIRDRMEEREDGTLRLMYRLDGTDGGMEEVELQHLSGYRGSRPVRLGNAAHAQTQRDIYGEVIDTLYLAHLNITEMTDRAHRNMVRIVNTVCDTWNDTGNGFWEMRGAPQYFLDAHLMSWVGIDRALRVSDRVGRPPEPHWREQRDAIRTTIETEFFNERIGAFTQYRGGETVDAVALLLPMMRFIRTTDERFCSTLAVIEERLVDGPFVRRYETPPDGIEGVGDGPEGHFVACSFWYIEVLARSRRLDEARKLFARMLEFASPLGLYAEEIATDGSHLGNTPQALSHLSLISAAAAICQVAAKGGEPF